MKRTLPILLSFCLFLIACGGEKTEIKPVKKKKPAKKETVAKADTKNGKKLFIANCSVCHMPNGLGVKGSFPPLVGTEWALGDADRMIEIVLKGFEEEIEINGDKYITPMVGLPHLKDDEIADILTYVRSAWGNDASAVSKEEVTAVRAKVM